MRDETDPVCMSCGASLTEPSAQEPEGPQPKVAERPTAETPTLKPKPEPVTPAPETKPSGISPLVKAVLVSVGIAVVEMLIVAFTHGGTTGIIPLRGTVALLVGGLVYGGLRGLMLGFLLKETKWSPGIALLLGLGLAFSLGRWPNYLFGAIAGFTIGMITEAAMPPPAESRRAGRPRLPR